MNEQNPYAAPERNGRAATNRPRSGFQPWKPLIILLPVGWSCVLPTAGVGSDFVQFSQATAVALTGATLISMGLAYYAVASIWRVPVGPIWLRLIIGVALLVPLGFWHILSLLVLWYWNLK